MKKNVTLIAIVGILLVLFTGAFGFFLVGKVKKPVQNSTNHTTETSSTSSETNTTTSDSTEFIQSDPDTAGLKSTGRSYGDEKGEYVMFHPEDFKLDVLNDGKLVRLVKTGATQKGQTEMYDGVIMTFETIDLEGKTLQTWVDNQMKESTADGTSFVVKPRTAITLHGYSGFNYELRGQGDSTFLVLQKNDQSHTAVSISYIVEDPQKIGYPNEVDAILSSIELLK